MLAMTSGSLVKKKDELDVLSLLFSLLFEYEGMRAILNCKRSKIAKNIESNLAELAALPQTSASESALEVHTLQSIRTVRGKSKSSGIKYYLLQRYVKEWNTFIND